MTNNLFVWCCQGHKGVDGIADENPESLIADIIVSTTDFLGDLIVIYRCWVIWQRNYYVVLLPLLSATAGLSELRFFRRTHPSPSVLTRRFQSYLPS